MRALAGDQVLSTTPVGTLLPAGTSRSPRCRHAKIGAPEAADAILTAEALEFVARLHRAFDARRQASEQYDHARATNVLPQTRQTFGMDDGRRARHARW